VFIDAPDIQSATYDKVEALISLLSDEFDFVLIDLGATWGVSTLSALSLSSSVFFLVEGTRQNMIGSFANLARISAESDDPSEFDYRKWTVLVNCLDTQNEANSLYNSIDNTIFGKSVSLFNIPLSSKGSDWCVSGYTLYGHGSKAYIQSIDEIIKQSFPDLSF
jgi:MinD-like ATPase involved in chromosome partitioning or flagellar assembly